MSVEYAFICDGCGARASGVTGGMYVHPDPPQGWTWRFGPGLDGPHACSESCWRKVCVAKDGRLILPDSHERDAWRQQVSRATPPSTPIEPPAQAVQPRVSQWVYFAQRGIDGPIKIGVSKNPISRVKELGAASAEGLRLLGVMPGSRRTEQEVHTLLSGSRLNGEWFRPSEPVMAYVREHARPL